MKRQRLIALSPILVVGILALSATPAAAGHRPKPQKFQGAAPGLVTCGISVKVKYSPAMTDHGGTATHTSVRVSGCHATDSRVFIRSAKVQKTSSTVAFSASQLNCQPVNTLPPAVAIQWNGTYTSTQGSINLRGKATYAPSSIAVSSEQVITKGNGDTGIGYTATVAPHQSFSGAASMSLYTTMSASKFASTCSGRGFHALKLSGTISVG